MAKAKYVEMFEEFDSLVNIASVIVDVLRHPADYDLKAVANSLEEKIKKLEGENG